MTRQSLMGIAAFGSLALILSALGFQYIGGMPPCKLCYWQRYGHFSAIALGVVAALLPARVIALAGAMAAGSSSVIGAYHTGVERGWWEGPTTCTSSPIGGMSAEDLMNQIMSAPLIRCDEVAWSMAGLSMASWNALASAVLAAIWLMAAFKPKL